MTLHVHTYQPACACDAPATGIARTGSGPVTEEWIRRWLGPHASLAIKPVLDIEGLAPVDAYEIPPRHRQAVSLMTPADIFPFATSTRTGAHQLDHTEAYDHTVDQHGRIRKRGQSRIDNYGPMTPFHHRIKTHGGWDVQQPYPGIYIWRDPFGAHYLVDHTGTRPVTEASRNARPSRLEIHLAKEVLDLAA